MSTRTPGPLGGENAVKVPADGHYRPVSGKRFHIDPGLNRDTSPRGGLADDFGPVGSDSGRQSQLVIGVAAGDGQLRGDQIHPGGLLGDGVFHLDARVHLEEDELVSGDQKFDGGQPAQADSGAQPGRGLMQTTA